MATGYCNLQNLLKDMYDRVSKYKYNECYHTLRNFHKINVIVYAQCNIII